MDLAYRSLSTYREIFLDPASSWHDLGAGCFSQ